MRDSYHRSVFRDIIGYVLVLGAILALDQVTKQWVVNTFGLYEVRTVIPGFFNLTYVTNSGAAFSILADVTSPWRHYFFLGIGGIAIVGLTGYYFRYCRGSWLYLAAFACVVGGAAGNLIDRVRYGVVIDFLDIYLGDAHWPTFNVADSAICIGAAIFVWGTFLESKKEHQEHTS